MQTFSDVNPVNVDGSAAFWAILFASFVLAIQASIWLLGGQPSAFIGTALLIAGGCFGTIYQVFRQGRAQRYSLDWYRKAFPSLVLREGGIRCRHCGSCKQVESGPEQSGGIREHACAHCGETLYFSRLP